MGRDEDVDWARYLDIQSRASGASGTTFNRLGDPTKWGGEETIPLRDSVTVETRTIIHAECADNYGRNWQMVGTLGILSAIYESDPVSYTGIIEVSMGVGQATITHLFSIRDLISLALSWPVYTTQVVGPITYYPWVISGGLIGQRVTMRQQHLAIEPPAGSEVRCAAILSPLAAGGL